MKDQQILAQFFRIPKNRKTVILKKGRILILLVGPWSKHEPVFKTGVQAAPGIYIERDPEKWLKFALKFRELQTRNWKTRTNKLNDWFLAAKQQQASKDIPHGTSWIRGPADTPNTGAPGARRNPPKEHPQLQQPKKTNITWNMMRPGELAIELSLWIPYGCVCLRTTVGAKNSMWETAVDG